MVKIEHLTQVQSCFKQNIYNLEIIVGLSSSSYCMFCKLTMATTKMMRLFYGKVSDQDDKSKVRYPLLSGAMEMKQNIWKIRQKRLVNGIFYQHIH